MVWYAEAHDSCRALYSMLLSQELARSGKTAMFLSILFKALKADVSPAQTIAFFKRLLQVYTSQAMPTT